MNRSLGLDDRVSASRRGRRRGRPPGAPGKLLDTLRLAANVPGATHGRACCLEGPNGLIVAVARPRPGGQGGELIGQIEDLARKGIVPGQIASDLHWIRVYANKRGTTSRSWN